MKYMCLHDRQKKTDENKLFCAETSAFSNLSLPNMWPSLVMIRLKISVWMKKTGNLHSHYILAVGPFMGQSYQLLGDESRRDLLWFKWYFR